jgi:H+-transporting ATPase
MGLKSLPLAKVEAELASSPQGLTQTETKCRLAQYGPNEIAEKNREPHSQIPRLFSGVHPLDDRSCGGPISWRSEHKCYATVDQYRGRMLVPGDVVRVRLGDVVPADARLLGEAPVKVESMLQSVCRRYFLTAPRVIRWKEDREDAFPG